MEDLLQISHSDTEYTYLSLPEEKRANWNEVFRNYFDKYIATKMKYFALYAIRDACPVVDKIDGITTNSTESFNFLLKDF